MLRLARPQIRRNIKTTACLKEGLIENQAPRKSQESQSKKLLSLAKKPELFDGNQIVETDEIEQLYRGVDVLLLGVDAHQLLFPIEKDMFNQCNSTQL